MDRLLKYIEAGYSITFRPEFENVEVLVRDEKWDFYAVRSIPFQEITISACDLLLLSVDDCANVLKKKKEELGNLERRTHPSRGFDIPPLRWGDKF